MKRKEVIIRLKEILEDKFVNVTEDQIINEYENLREWLALNGTPLKLITGIKECGIDCYGLLVLQIGLKTYDNYDVGSVEYSILI